MRFDTVIIGGGLSGLVCGLQLQKAGQRTAVVSEGCGALGLMSGAFGLLGRIQGKEVSNPIQEVALLPDEHPYRRIGGAMVDYVNAAKGLLESIGIGMCGDCTRNHYRLSPIGELMPAWLSMEDLLPVGDAGDFIGKRVGIVSFAGFLDFPGAVLSRALRKLGAEVGENVLELPSLMRARENVSEFRSVHVARRFADSHLFEELVQALARIASNFDFLLLPAVFDSINQVRELRSHCEDLNCRMGCVATLPPSVLGLRLATALGQAYVDAGGILLANNSVEGAKVSRKRVESVRVDNLGADHLEASAFVHAGGKFYGKGLQSSREGTGERIFGCDVVCDGSREEWLSDDFFDGHAFSRYGLRTSVDFRALVEGEEMQNLYVVGSLLGGCDSLAEGSGGGVALLTALRVADAIVKG